MKSQMNFYHRPILLINKQNEIRENKINIVKYFENKYKKPKEEKVEMEKIKSLTNRGIKTFKDSSNEKSKKIILPKLKLNDKIKKLVIKNKYIGIFRGREHKLKTINILKNIANLNKELSAKYTEDLNHDYSFNIKTNSENKRQINHNSSLKKCSTSTEFYLKLSNNNISTRKSISKLTKYNQFLSSTKKDKKIIKKIYLNDSKQKDNKTIHINDKVNNSFNSFSLISIRKLKKTNTSSHLNSINRSNFIKEKDII